MFLKKIIYMSILYSLFLPKNACADFDENFFGLGYNADSSNGKFTNDLAGITILYQKSLPNLKILRTETNYRWYFDFSASYRVYDIEDPLPRLQITSSAYQQDLSANSYSIEMGLTRMQYITEYVNWSLGFRAGTFTSQSDVLTDVDVSSQPYRLKIESELGFCVQSHAGLVWSMTSNYRVQTMIQMRKYYLHRFFVTDDVSGRSARYEDYASIGLALTVGRSF